MVELVITRNDAGLVLNVIAGRVGDLTDPLTLALADALSEGRQRFVTKGPGPEGEVWPPPSPKTRYGVGQSLLVRSERLLDSLNPEMAGNLFEVTPTHGTAGTTIFYADFQQSGTTRIPARPYLGFDPAKLDALTQTFWNYIFANVPEEPRFG